MDSINLDQLNFTATRSDRLLVNLPLPYNIIQSAQIRNLGITRLQEILAEQPGLTVVPQINGLGNGIQIQGLSPDYTLILIDGEPLIGRYTGSLELNRISVSNIKKIEIIKGPSSSLYGSEALAGVINIITDQAVMDKTIASVRYASRNTFDANVLLAQSLSKLRVVASGNYFRSDGYDLSPELYGQTVSPYYNYSGTGKIFYTPNKRHEFLFSARAFDEIQKNEYQVVSNADSIKVYGKGKVLDQNFNASYKFKINPKLGFHSSLYYTHYLTQTNLNNTQTDSLYYYDRFDQNLYRAELICTYSINHLNKLLFGAGQTYESVNSPRYGENKLQHQNTKYLFLQHEWFEKSERWNLITGIRMDDNQNYTLQWSPKLALLYKLNSKLTIKASYGAGFKAPDFRQLYLNFNNQAAAYSVFGSEVVKSELKRLSDQNQLEQIFIPLDADNKINAERSKAINLGGEYRVSEKILLDINLFRNDLTGLIETMVAAKTVNQRNIYTYTNVQRAFTQGLEFNSKIKINNFFSIQTSYQYLIAKDKDILNSVQEGKIFGRDPITYNTYKIKTTDYIGLANRSRHQGFIKLNYVLPKINGTIQMRLFYRGKFGLFNTSGNVSGVIVPGSDINSNGILDQYDELVKDYWTMNLSFQKSFRNRIEMVVGAENLTNYKDPEHIPNLVGRTLFFNLNYRLQ